MSQELESYATMAIRWWQARDRQHGRSCPCLPCADCRAYLKLPALKPEPVKERSAA